MQKINVLKTSAFLLLTISTAAYAIERTDKIPSFFMPAGAIKSTSTPEKLPPVQQMQQKLSAQQSTVENKSTKTVSNVAPRATEKNEQKTLLAVENIAAGNSTGNKNMKKQKTVENLQKNITTNPEKQQNATLLQSDKKLAEELQKIISSGPQVKLQNKPITSKQSQLSHENKGSFESVASFEQINNEYQNDLQEIIKGKSVKNERLNKMVQDFKDNTLKM